MEDHNVNANFLEPNSCELSILANHEPLFAGQIETIVNNFYDILLSDISTKVFLSDPKIVEKLKKTQIIFLMEMFSGKIDRTYKRKRIEVGLAHYNVQLPPQIYLGAYSVLFSEFSNVVQSSDLDENQKIVLIKALNKIMFFDQSLAINAYVAKTCRILTKKNEYLQDLNAKINQFVGVVMHDLRNPLGAVIGFSDLIISQGKDFEFIDDVKSIRRNGQIILEIVNELLDISVLESGRVGLEKKETNLNSLYLESASLLERIAKNKNVSIDLSISPPDAKAIIDSQKIRQALDNLLSNAIKYTYPDSSVKVSIIKDGTNLSVSIADSGIGIEKSDWPKIFTAFGKTSSKPTAGESSTGLGLFIVKKIVEAHGGKVWFESNPDQGSTFGFSIPNC